MTEARRPSRLDADSGTGGRSFPGNALPVSVIPNRQAGRNARFRRVGSLGLGKVGPPSAKILRNDVEPLQREGTRWSSGQHENQSSNIKGGSVGTDLRCWVSRPPPKNRTATLPWTRLCPGDTEKGASFWNIKGIAEDKGEERDVSFPGEPWTCPPASSCGQLFDCFSPSTN